MGVLIGTQVRLIGGSLALWTLLGLVMVVFTSGRIESVGNLPPETFFLTVLAAAIGARLFAGEARGGQGAWLRSLPIAPARLFAIKLGVGFGAIVLATVVFAATGALDLAGLWMSTKTLRVLPLWTDWASALLWCATIFTVSAYFANAYERVLASLQAGLAGWFASLWLVRATEALGLPEGGEALQLLAIVALGLGAAYRLFRRRGVYAATNEERVLGDPRPVDALLTVPAQLLFVALPLLYVAYSLNEDFAPFLPWGRWAMAGGVCVLAGVLFLPWTVRQIRAHALRAPAAAGVLLLGLSGLGAFVWKSVRGKGPVARCSGCGRRRRVALERCPACGAAATTRVGPAGRRQRRVPSTPYTWGALLVLTSVSWFGWLGSLRWFHGWELVASDPDAWILRDGEVVGRGRASGFTLGGRLESLPATMSMTTGFSSGFDDPPAEHDPAVAELSVAVLLQGLHEPAPDAGLSPARLLREAFPRGSTFALRLDGPTTRIRRATSGTIRALPGMTSLTVTLEAVHPDLAADVQALALALRDPACTETRIRKLGEGTNAFLEALRDRVPPRVRFELVDRVERERITYLVHRPIPVDEERRAERAAGLRAIDVLLRERYGLDEGDAGTTAAIWAELDDRRSRLAELEEIGDSTQLFEAQKALRPQLRALALALPAGRGELLRRLDAGDPFAALVAGDSGDAELFDGLARAYERGESPSWSQAARHDGLVASRFLLAAAWGLVALDPERGTAVLLRRLEEDPEPAALEALAVGADPRAAAAADRWLAAGDRELAERVRIRSRSALQRVRVWLEAVQLGIEWELQPVDWRENLPFYTLTQNVRATRP